MSYGKIPPSTRPPGMPSTASVPAQFGISTPPHPQGSMSRGIQNNPSMDPLQAGDPWGDHLSACMSQGQSLASPSSPGSSHVSGMTVQGCAFATPTPAINPMAFHGVASTSPMPQHPSHTPQGAGGQDDFGGNTSDRLLTSSNPAGELGNHV
eukprot:1978691-Amphidinium_carterae.1